MIPHQNHTVLRLCLLVLLILSCNLPVAAPRASTPEPNSTSEASTPAPNEVIIPSTTKVIDSASLSTLERVDEKGTLYFSQATPAVEALKAGDVLVSEASSAAPFGLLKKVIAVRAEGERIIVETTDALITEAVHQGSGSVSRELKPEDIRSTQIFQEGVTFEGFDASSQISARSHGLMSMAPSALLRPAGLTYRFNTDLGTGGQVQVTGTATINPIMDFGLNISCDEVVNTFLGRVCKEIPDLNVLAKVGVQENANLVIKGASSYTFKEDYQIARHEFSPITFFLGPVPVVLVPVLKIYLKGDGSLTAKFDYVVDQNLTLAAGFKYNSDNGFEDLSEYKSGFKQTGPTFSGALDVRAMMGVQFEIMLYGAIGPYGNLEGGAHLQANLDGLPSAKNLLWNADGCLWLNVGIDSVKAIDLHYNKELWSACVSFGNGENHPPSVSIISPTDGSALAADANVTLLGSASDVDNQPLTCVWTSNNAYDTITDANCTQATIKFAAFESGSPSRALTLTATDSSGASASATVNVSINHSPQVKISNPAEGSVFKEGESIFLAANVLDFDGGALTCIWTSSAAGDVIKNPSNCAETKIKWIGAGSRTITLTATDASGLSGKASVTVNVVAAPPAAINVEILSPISGSVFNPSNPITLSGSASGGREPYTFKWSVRYPTDSGGNGGESYIIGNGDNFTWTPSDTLPFSCGEKSAAVILTVRDQDGKTGSTFVVIRLVRIC